MNYLKYVHTLKTSKRMPLPFEVEFGADMQVRSDPAFAINFGVEYKLSFNVNTSFVVSDEIIKESNEQDLIQSVKENLIKDLHVFLFEDLLSDLKSIRESMYELRMCSGGGYKSYSHIDRGEAEMVKMNTILQTMFDKMTGEDLPTLNIK